MITGKKKKKPPDVNTFLLVNTFKFSSLFVLLTVRFSSVTISLSGKTVLFVPLHPSHLFSTLSSTAMWGGFFLSFFHKTLSFFKMNLGKISRCCKKGNYFWKWKAGCCRTVFKCTCDVTATEEKSNVGLYIFQT